MTTKPYLTSSIILLLIVHGSFSKDVNSVLVVQDRTNYIPPYMREGDYGDPYACNGLNWTHRRHCDHKCSMSVLDSILSWGAPGGDSTTCDVIFNILDKDKVISIGYADGRIVDFRRKKPHTYFLFDSVFTISTRVLEKCGIDSIQIREHTQKGLRIQWPTDSSDGTKK